MHSGLDHTKPGEAKRFGLLNPITNNIGARTSTLGDADLRTNVNKIDYLTC
jgi:hypothetical protein